MTKFGKRYRVKYEESRQAEYGEMTRTKDPWLMILLCYHGHICPWGGMLLAACTKGRGGIRKRLQRLPFVKLEMSQIGDDGSNIVFHISHIDEVLEIMRPKKRRQVTEEQRQAARERFYRLGIDRKLRPQTP